METREPLHSLDWRKGRGRSLAGLTQDDARIEHNSPTGAEKKNPVVLDTQLNYLSQPPLQSGGITGLDSGQQQHTLLPGLTLQKKTPCMLPHLLPLSASARGMQ